MLTARKKMPSNAWGPFLFLCITLVFCIDVSAQCAPTEAVEKPVAVKVLEIGRTSSASFSETMKRFAESHDPDVRLYIINYGSAWEIARRERLITGAPVRWQHHHSRITLVRGGGKVAKTVVWEIPPGADNPVP